MWVYLDQMTYSCSVRFSDGGAAIAQSRRQCVEEFRCRLTKKEKDTNQIGFSIYAKFLSRKLFWALYLIPPIPSLLSNQCLLAHKWRILYIKRLYYNNESRRPSGWGGVGWGVEGNDIWVQIVLTSKVWFCLKKVTFETMKAMNKILR